MDDDSIGEELSPMTEEMHPVGSGIQRVDRIPVLKIVLQTRGFNEKVGGFGGNEAAVGGSIHASGGEAAKEDTGDVVDQSRVQQIVDGRSTL